MTETRILVFHRPLLARPSLGHLIQLEFAPWQLIKAPWRFPLVLGHVAKMLRWWSRTGSHMAFERGGVVAEAAWPTVQYTTVEDAVSRGSIVHAFRLRPPLIEDAETILWNWLKLLRDMPALYDWLGLGTRGLAEAQRLRRKLAGKSTEDIVAADWFGSLAYICYELVARGIIHLIKGDYRPSLLHWLVSRQHSGIIPLDRFGPLMTWEMADAGHLWYDGKLNKETRQ